MITTSSIVLMLGLFAQVFGVVEVSAEVRTNTTSSSRSSVNNSVTISTGGTTVHTQESTKAVRGVTEIRSRTTVNGEVIPESVVDVTTDDAYVSSHNRVVVEIDEHDEAYVSSSDRSIEIIQEESITDEDGEPLIERQNLTTEQTTHEPSVLARAWQAFIGFLSGLFG